MIALVLAFLLVAQEPAAPPAGADAPIATAEPASPVAPTPPEAPALPTGAPTDDYGLVGWCLGVLEGYLAQHDRVMPDVTRIESTYRRPGSSLEDDLKVYADQQAQGRLHLAAFTKALQTAEKASLSALRPRGEAAIAKGRSVWAPAANLPTRSVAQQWMGWTLPKACPIAAERLTLNAALLGAAFDPAAEMPPPPAPEVPATEPPPSPEPASAPAATEPGAPAEPLPNSAPLTQPDAPASEALPEAPFEAPAPEGPPALRESPGAQ
ncbi:MAG: hypothetical protein LW830_11560 [Phenylobacterium sp.]|nr:hypothetical protein [Phenylobacterium sp.]